MNFDLRFVELSLDLDRSGLVWHPEIGDEVSLRQEPTKISILVEPEGMTPSQLRESFVWLPTLEQLVSQFEAREAFIYHAGINNALAYEAVVKSHAGVIETSAATLRLAFAMALQQLLDSATSAPLH